MVSDQNADDASNGGETKTTLNVGGGVDEADEGAGDGRSETNEEAVQYILDAIGTFAGSHFVHAVIERDREVVVTDESVADQRIIDAINDPRIEVEGITGWDEREYAISLVYVGTPDEGGADTNDEGEPEVATDGGVDVDPTAIDYPTTIECPGCGDWAEEEVVTYVADGVDVTYACEPGKCGWCGARAYEGEEPELVTDGGVDVGHEDSKTNIIDELHEAGLYADVDVQFSWSPPEDTVSLYIVGLQDASVEVAVHPGQSIPAGEYEVKREKTPLGEGTILTRTLSYELRCVDEDNGGDDGFEVATDGGEDVGTARDRAWLSVIDLLGDAAPMTVTKIAEGANVHLNTARSVLHVAEAYGLLTRDTPQAHTYHPNIGPLANVANPEYRRAIATLIGEANQED